MGDTRKVTRSYKEQTPEEKAEARRLAELAESEADQAQIDREVERYERMRELVAGLNAERERQGLTVHEVAARAGMEPAALNRLEISPNANPTLDTLHQLAEALGKHIHVELSDEPQAA